jgi:hypothetical protein
MAEKLPTKLVFVGGAKSGVSTIIRRITDKPFITVCDSFVFARVEILLEVYNHENTMKNIQIPSFFLIHTSSSPRHQTRLHYLLVWNCTSKSIGKKVGMSFYGMFPAT